MTTSASKSGAAGEYIVLGELLRHRQEAYLAQGSVQPDWDIISLYEKEIIKIQVKTIDWPNQKAVNLKGSAICHYIVVVLLNRGEKYPLLYVFTKQDFENFLSSKNPKRIDKKQTVNFNSNAKEKYRDFEGKWWFDKIGN